MSGLGSTGFFALVQLTRVPGANWTASAHRCDRDLSGRFGSEAYAMEELVAELGAAFLCAELGITVEPRADHAQYLAHWLTVLKADKRAIFTAASKAAEAAAFLRKEN
jgi:antirestriction protein ArdC